MQKRITCQKGCILRICINETRTRGAVPGSSTGFRHLTRPSVEPQFFRKNNQPEEWSNVQTHKMLTMIYLTEREKFIIVGKYCQFEII